jgi:hypothetical protein
LLFRQGVLFFTIAFNITSNLRIHATNANFFTLPAAGSFLTNEWGWQINGIRLD